MYTYSATNTSSNCLYRLLFASILIPDLQGDTRNDRVASREGPDHWGLPDLIK